MDIAHSIAGDLLRLALQRGNGKLHHASALAQSARGALLIDLAYEGRIVSTADQTEIDTTPVGWAAADRMLEDIDAHPDATMQRLLLRGRPHLSELIDDLVASGLWHVKRGGITPGRFRYDESDADRYREILDRIDEADWAAQGIERDAALVALALTSRLGARGDMATVSEEHFTACGSLEWITRDVVTFIRTAAAIAQASIQYGSS